MTGSMSSSTEYVVKHRGCGRDALINEWIAGRIGRKLELPIPDIEILTFDQNLARLAVFPGAGDLAACPSFGSCFVPSSVSLLPSSVSDVPPELRAEILLFDWWVLNGDRAEGNTNLLWVAHEAALKVIDHNLAFDPAEDADSFWGHHIFRADYRSWTPEFRSLMTLKMRAIIAGLPRLWNELPDEWTDDCDTTLEKVDTILRRCESPSFWDV